MRIYIDSADLSDIKNALATGYVYGVTTNPTLLRRANVRAGQVPELARQAIAHGAKELHLQTYADDKEGIVREGTELARLDPERIVVKVPAVPEGYAAAAQLAANGLRVTMTAVYNVRQTILADAVGAHYIAVYLGRMRDQGLDALELVGQMQRCLDVQGSQVEILAASVRTPEEIEALALLGVATATLPWKVLSRLLDSEATDAATRAFLEDSGAIQ
jgi:transaldolase